MDDEPEDGPDVGSGTSEVDEQVPTFALFRRVLQTHGALWQERLPEVTKQQQSVLRAVRAHPGVDQNTAGALAATDKATLAPLITRLEQRGLLVRDTDAVDRRRRTLWLTAQGCEFVDRNAPIAAEADHAMLDVLSDAEHQELRRLLVRLLPEERLSS